MRINHFKHLQLSPLTGEIFFDFYKVTCKVGYEINEDKSSVTVYRKWGDLESFPKEYIKDLKKILIDAYVKKECLFLLFEDLSLEYKNF